MIKIGNNISSFSTYSYRPANREELKKIINERINKYGTECDLNDIDTSLITDMSWLFYNLDFIGDISKWDTSKVENMVAMFAFSKFNQDISNWKINKDCKTTDMFNKSSIKDEYKLKSLHK